MIQWLRLCAPNAKGTSLITGQGTKTPHATQHNQKKKKSQRKLLSNNVYNELVAMHLTVFFANFFFFTTSLLCFLLLFFRATASSCSLRGKLKKRAPLSKSIQLMNRLQTGHQLPLTFHPWAVSNLHNHTQQLWLSLIDITVFSGFRWSWDLK